MSWLHQPFLYNEIRHWLMAVVAFFIIWSLLRLVRSILHAKIGTLAARTDTQLDDLMVGVIQSTKNFFLLTLSAYFAFHLLQFPAPWGEFVQKAVVLITLFQVSIWGSTAIQFWMAETIKARAASDPALATTLGFLNFIAKLALYILLVLLALNNLGVNITALVAGLGVGGIAVALAVQNILGDLLASLTIVLDKPFVVGDAISVAEFTGTIEYIGLKTTRLRSVTGEQIIFPNSNLLQSRIRNLKRMQERRVLFTLGMVYDLTPEKLESIPKIIREIIESKSKVRFERSHFIGYGESSLNFETVYWVTEPDFQAHMNLQQEIYFEIFRRFNKEGIEFAYPTQSLLIKDRTSQ